MVWNGRSSFGGQLKGYPSQSPRGAGRTQSAQLQRGDYALDEEDWTHDEEEYYAGDADDDVGDDTAYLCRSCDPNTSSEMWCTGHTAGDKVCPPTSGLAQ